MIGVSPIRIFRCCMACRRDFAIRDMSSRAVYCPKCRKEIRAEGMVLSLDRTRYQDEANQAA
jgi:PHP family Zn ribbon phosphoesterase